MKNGIKAVGTKVLIQRGSAQNFLDAGSTLAQFPGDLHVEGVFGKVLDMGSKVELDLSEDDLAIIDKKAGLPVTSSLNESMGSEEMEMRLVDESFVYGAFGINEEMILTEHFNQEED